MFRRALAIYAGTRYLGGDPEGLVDRELLVPVEPVPERLPVHERHHIENGSVHFP